jgi:hypothetical protein
MSNNVIHRTQSVGPSINSRKVVTVDKNPYLQSTISQTPPAESSSTEDKAQAQAVVEQVAKVEDNNSTASSDQRAKARADFSALEKSRRLEAEAKAKLKKAQEMSDAYESKDLDRIARAHNMSTSDYVRWVNATAIGAPTDKPLSAQEQIARNQQAWQQQVNEKLSHVDKQVNDLNKLTYINKNILPHLIKAPDKYEFIHDKGVDEQCGIIYDFMNQHWLESGKTEELDPTALLDALEGQYLEEWKETQAKAAKFKKLQRSEMQKSSEQSPNPNSPSTTAKTVSAPKGTSSNAPSEAELFAGINGAPLGDSEDALAQEAPSNLIAGPSRGSSNNKNEPPRFITGGTTPKNSKFSRKVRLAAMQAERKKV